MENRNSYNVDNKTCSVQTPSGVHSVDPKGPTGSREFWGKGDSSTTMASGKGLRTGKAMPSCERNTLEGSDLALSCIKEATVTMLRLWGTYSMTQGILGNLV